MTWACWVAFRGDFEITQKTQKNEAQRAEKTFKNGFAKLKKKINQRLNLELLCAQKVEVSKLELRRC